MKIYAIDDRWNVIKRFDSLDHADQWATRFDYFQILFDDGTGARIYKHIPKKTTVNMEESNDSYFERAYTSLCKMQVAKDKRYGSSALKPLDIFAKHHPYGSRLDEKLARVKNSDELRKNDVADIIGGLMLLCKDRGWDNFEDLID